MTTIVGTSMLISADMGQDGIARGSVQPDPANFMRTRQKPDYPARLDEAYAAARDQPGDQVRALSGPMPDLWTDWELRCLYELNSPDIENRSATCEDGTEILWLLAADGSWARAEEASSSVHQSGPQRLWDELEHVQAKWDAGGRFPLHEMTVELGPDRNTLVSPDKKWTLGL